MKAVQLDELAALIASSLKADVDAALTRIGGDLLIQEVTTTVRASEVYAPVVLVDHERRVLAALRDGEATAADVAGLDVEHFHSRLRGLAFGALLVAAQRGEVLGAEGLRRVLLHAHPRCSDAIDLLLAEIEGEPVYLGPQLKSIVAEVVAAAAWRDFFDGVRRLNAQTRASALGCHGSQPAGAIDARRLRQALRSLAETLTPALRACEESDL